MKKYAGLSDEEMDDLTLDIFEVKKLNQVDKEAQVDYIKFCDKIFVE